MSEQDKQSQDRPGGTPSDPEDQSYWPMIGGVRFDTRDVEAREELFADLMELSECEFEDAKASQPSC